MAAADCARSCAPRRSISASIGATSTSSSRSARQRAAPPRAAHRPRQPPARRAVASGARAQQPVRSAGMPRRARGGRGKAQLDGADFRIGALDCSPSTSSAAPAANRSTPTSSMPRCAPPRPTPISPAPISIACVDFVATGGYALEGLRALRQDPPGAGRPLARRASARRPAIPHECRHHRRGRHAQGAARRVRDPIAGCRRSAAQGGKSASADLRGRGHTGRSRAADACSARSRNISSSSSCPATPSCSPARLRLPRRCRDEVLRLARRPTSTPQIPSYEGGKFPLSTYLADRVRDLLAEPGQWHKLPDQVRDWLGIQQWRSRGARAGDLLVETFPRADKLSRLLSVRRPPRAPDAGHAADAPARARAAASARLRRQRIRAGGVGARRRRAGDSARRLSLAALFDQDMLGDDLEAGSRSRR